MQKEQVRLIPNCGRAFSANDWIVVQQWLTEQNRCCPFCLTIGWRNMHNTSLTQFMTIAHASWHDSILHDAAALTIRIEANTSEHSQRMNQQERTNSGKATFTLLLADAANRKQDVGKRKFQHLLIGAGNYLTELPTTSLFLVFFFLLSAVSSYIFGVFAADAESGERRTKSVSLGRTWGEPIKVKCPWCRTRVQYQVPSVPW